MNSAPVPCLFLTHSKFSLNICNNDPTHISTVIGIQCQLPGIVIPQEVLRGQYGTTVNGYTFKAYEGMPHARSPMGKYRFKVMPYTNPISELRNIG